MIYLKLDHPNGVTRQVFQERGKMLLITVSSPQGIFSFHATLSLYYKSTPFIDLLLSFLRLFETLKNLQTHRNYEKNFSVNLCVGETFIFSVSAAFWQLWKKSQ